MLLKPKEAGPYVFCRQCVMLAAKSEKFWCATEKSTQLDWQARLFSELPGSCFVFADSII